MRAYCQFALVGAVVVVAGCGPEIEMIKSMPPLGTQRLATVTIEGDRMTGAVIDIDGQPCGSASASWTADPLKRRDIVIPLETQTPGVLTGPNVTVKAWDPFGDDVHTIPNVTATAPGATTPNITNLSPPGIDLFTNRVVVHVFGSNLYPGVGAGTVALGKAFGGPEAWAVDGATLIPADQTVFVGDGNIQAYFRRTGANALTSGTSYKIRIKNHRRYGNLQTQSATTFTAP